VVANDGDVYWVTFNADGSRIASGGTDVALLDGRTGELLSSAKVPGPQHATYPGFRPDGTLTVASSSGDAYHWDPSLGRTIAFACRAAGRDMTRAEWAAELPGRSYRSVCPSTG
jgi:WD40 repeat protein